MIVRLPRSAIPLFFLYHRDRLIARKKVELFGKNLAQLKVVFFGPLKRAKDRLASIVSTYNNPYNFAHDARQIAIEEVQNQQESGTFVLDLNSPLAQRMLNDFLHRDLHEEMAIVNGSFMTGVLVALCLVFASLLAVMWFFK